MNSKLFHKAINVRRRNNNLVVLEVVGEWVEVPCRVKEAVREHFQRRSEEKAWLGDCFEFPKLDEKWWGIFLHLRSKRRR